MTSLAVMLVEDDPAAIELVANALRPWRDELHVLTSAHEALEARQPVDVALVDVGVQSGAGMALAHFLRARDPQIAIVALTPGDAESEMVASALGADATLPKPLTGDALLVALSRVRERKAARERATSRRPPSQLGALLDAADFRTLATVLAQTAADLTGAPARVVLEDARGGEVVGRSSDASPEKTTEALVLAAQDESIGTLYLTPGAPGLEAPGVRTEIETLAHAAAAVGVLQRRAEAIARVGIKDPDTSAYTFSYFVDVAGREVERARRYGRRFALITFLIDDYAELLTRAGDDAVREARRELVDTILDSVRDSDVLAHVEDDELYLLVPEAGMLGALSCRRRIAERQGKRAELARLEGRPALNVTIGVATYPRDGRDLTALLKAAHKRGNATRTGVAGAVIREQRGGLEATLGALLRFRPEEGSWQMRQAAFPPDVIAAVAAAAAREATRGGAGARDGMLYVLGERGHPLVRGALDELRLSAGAGTPAYWLRPAGTESSSQGLRMYPTEIEIDGQRVGPFALLAVLTEGWAYACVASEHGEYKRVMHSCELELVEALMAELQTTFHLQRGLE